MASGQRGERTDGVRPRERRRATAQRSRTSGLRLAKRELTPPPPSFGARRTAARVGRGRRRAHPRRDKPPGVRIRRAAEADLEVIAAILTDGAERARALGILGFWPIPFPEERVRDSLGRGEVVILERGGIPVGTLALARTDVPYWGEQPPIAGYIHRFAVLRRWSGDGLGDRLLDWAAEEVRRWGRPKLRLDTLAGNPRLVGYYLDRGFRLVGRVRLRTFAGPRRLVLLEKELGPSERKSKTAARPRSKVR